MTAQDRATPHFRIPEPHQVAAWLHTRWHALRRYLAVPEHQAFLGVILLGLVLRLSFLDLIPIRSESIALLSQLAALQKGTLPTLSLAAPSQGVPGLLVYLHWLPSLISRDPRWLVAVQVGLSTASLLFFYYLVRRRLGLLPAFAALTLLSVNPWAVYYGRTLTPDAWYLPLAVMLLYGLDKALCDRSLCGWLIIMVSLVLMIYLSVTNIALGLVLLVVLWIFRSRVVWLYVLLVSLFAVVLLIPGLYGANLQRFAGVVAWLKQWAAALIQPRTVLSTLKEVVWLLSGQRLGLLAEPVPMSWGAWSPLLLLGRMLGWLTIVALPWSCWAALAAWGRWRKQGAAELLVIASVWLMLGLLAAFHPASARLGSGALLTIMPVAALALACALERLLAMPNQRRWQRYWWSQPLRLAMMALLVTTALWQSYQTVHLNGHVGVHDVSAVYGVPYRYWRRTANLVQREARLEELTQLWMINGDDQGVLALAPEMLDYLLHGQVQVVELGNAAVEGVLLPAARAGLYLSTGAAPLAERAVAQLGAQDRGVVLFPDGETRLRVQLLTERPVAELLESIQVRGLWAFDAGAKLLGYDWPPSTAPGQTINLATYWTFADVPPDDRVLEHRFFVRLIDEQGELLAEGEGLALAEADWQSGSLLKQWWQVALPQTTLPPQAYMLIGMYRPADGHRNQYVDAQGQPLGDAVMLGPVGLAR